MIGFKKNHLSVLRSIRTAQNETKGALLTCVFPRSATGIVFLVLIGSFNRLPLGGLVHLYVYLL